MNALRGGVLASVLAVSACAVGPDFKRPEPPHVDRYVPGTPPASSDAQRFIDSRPVPANWWSAFGSPELDALVAEALRANPTVAAAQAALRQARENYLAQRGAYFPTVAVSGDASRNRNAVQVLSPTLTSGEALFNLYTADVSVAYTLDLFGANRRAVESLEALADAGRFQLDATYLTVAGNVVVAAIQQAGLAAEVEATERTIGFGRESLGILKRQLELGAIDRLDVAAQEAALAQLEGSLPPLRRQLEATRHLLAVLTGRLPADAPADSFSLASLSLPAEIPLGVPTELVNRRPDVRAAEAGLHAATAADGVAIANLLPQIAIAGSIGSSATAVADVLKAGTGFWSIGADLTQTLFAGGALVHRKRAADAALDEAGAQYRATVLGAFQNVADALRALETDGAALEAASRAQRAAEESMGIVHRQLELGGVSYLGLIAAEQTYEQATLAELAARTSRLADTAVLYQALAGPVTAR
ncbi:MAG TPA: efflux transporter outer membrane subunit [Steroidobacteraceae bacterium]|nr:efflux transporter outer membrane subunit [Steroidobacteraceae bacterium]